MSSFIFIPILFIAGSLLGILLGLDLYSPLILLFHVFFYRQHVNHFPIILVFLGFVEDLYLSPFMGKNSLLYIAAYIFLIGTARIVQKINHFFAVWFCFVLLLALNVCASLMVQWMWYKTFELHNKDVIGILLMVLMYPFIFYFYKNSNEPI
jgi:hypothetical protein